MLVVYSMWQDASNADAEVRRTHRTGGEGDGRTVQYWILWTECGRQCGADEQMGGLTLARSRSRAHTHARARSHTHKRARALAHAHTGSLQGRVPGRR